MRILSTSFCTSTGGALVMDDTKMATMKLKIMPNVPIPSGEIPNQY